MKMHISVNMQYGAVYCVVLLAGCKKPFGSPVIFLLFREHYLKLPLIIVCDR